MKEKIVDLSIQKLRTEGLRFSVDTIAKELKISKKTVYRYFSSKESLAAAIYEKFYRDAEAKLAGILAAGGSDRLGKLLECYLLSFYMIRKEIFNKYALNDGIRAYALARHERLWEMLEPVFPDGLKKTAKIMTDGTLEKLVQTDADAAPVIERLVKCYAD